MFPSTVAKRNKSRKERWKLYRFDADGVALVGEILRSAREKRELSTEELAKLSGVTTSQINDIEKGRRDKLAVDDLKSIWEILQPVNPDTGKTWGFYDLYDLCVCRVEPEQQQVSPS